MQVSSFTGLAASATKMHTIATRADLTGDPSVDFAGNWAVNPWAFFTDDDLGMIRQMSGITIDPMTGRGEGPAMSGTMSASMADFMNDLSDRRMAEYMAKKTPARLDEGGIRDIFKKAVVDCQNLDPALLQKALDWLGGGSGSGDSSRAGSPSAAAAPIPRVDIYA